MNTSLQTFNFHGTPVAIIDHNNEAWITGDDIGKALEYNHPRQRITGIFGRYRDELEGYSVELNLSSTDGKSYNTRVYNEEGVMLISMFSNQPKAKAFRRWAVQVLKQYRHAEQPEIKQNAYETLQSKYIALLEQENARLKTPVTGGAAEFGPRRWTASEKQHAIGLRLQGFGFARIAFELGRSRDSVRNKFVKDLDRVMEQPGNQADVFMGVLV